MSNINNDVAMSWDDTISNDSEFTLLSPGEYDFEVLGFERKRFEGSAKMSPCPMAELSIKVFDKGNPDVGSTTLKHNLFLNRKCEGILCAFFIAIGQRKHGEELRMNWALVKGAKGRCKVDIRKWISKNGDNMESNEIKRFLEPDAPVTPKKNFTSGQW